jgi:hypothetical protein
MSPPALKVISSLSPTEFENLTYDLAQASGLRNLVWRTPGADGGRDIEGIAHLRDLTGHFSTQRWYVECKRYSASVDWPTVWKKIAYADVQGADVLLLCTNSNPSPDCESEIAKWNNDRRRPLIRVWRGYELAALLLEHNDIAIAYGLSGVLSPSVETHKIHGVIGRILQAAYVTHTFEQDPFFALEAGSCLSELVSKRLAEYMGYGRFLDVPNDIDNLGFDWLVVSAIPIRGWDDVGLRSLLALLRYQVRATTMELFSDEHAIHIKVRDAKRGVSLNELELVARWCRVHLRKL